MKKHAAQIFIWAMALAATTRILWEVITQDVATPAVVAIGFSVLLTVKLAAENLVRIVTAARANGANR